MRLIYGQLFAAGVAVAIAAVGIAFGQTGVPNNPPAGNTPNFVSGYTTQSPGIVANLLTNSPCVSNLVGEYAVVSDLYLSAAPTNEVMRCTSSGLLYYWRPQRTDFASSVSVTGGVQVLTCMVSPPSIFYNGALVSNLTLNLSSTNCWPGARFDIASNVTLGAFGVTVTGLVNSTTKILGLNAHYTFIYDGANWQFYQ